MKLKFTTSALATVFAVALGGIAEAKNNEVPGISAQPSTYFYTGKPYDNDFAGYVFNYRTYSPSINRWTSLDPSGFPDGANQHLYIKNNISGMGVDPTGLAWNLVNASGMNMHIIYKDYAATLGGWAVFSGSAYATSDFAGGGISVSLTGTGKAHVLDGQDSFQMGVGIGVSMDPNTGELTYSGSGNFSADQDSINGAFDFDIDGQGTHDLYIHVTVGYALNASVFSGGGIGEDGVEIGFSGTTYGQIEFAGDWNFYSVWE